MNRICVAIAGSFLLWAVIPAHACDWTGAGADNNWSTAANWDFCGGTPPQGGETLVFPDNAARKANFNDIAGLNVGQLVFNGWEYHISGNGIELSFGIVVNLPQPEPPLPGVAHFPHLELDLVLVNDQTFESFSGSNPLHLLGEVDLNGVALTVDVQSWRAAVLSGDVTGNGAIIKNGPDLLSMQGTGSDYTGMTTVNQGRLSVGSDQGLGADGPGNGTVVNSGAELLISGVSLGESLTLAGGALRNFNFTEDSVLSGSIELADNTVITNAASLSTLTVTGTISGAYDLTKVGESPVVLSGDNSYSGLTKITEGVLLIDGNQAAAGGVIVSGGGTLGGIGTVNWIDTAPGGAVSPGTSPGILAAAGGVELGNDSFLQIELQGPDPGSGYDQLVAGSVDPSTFVSLAGADGPVLEVTVEFDPPPGMEFVIIDNQTANAVLGTFAGLPEGAMFAAGGRAFQISYSGGDGNDVVLIAVDDTLFRDRFEE